MKYLTLFCVILISFGCQQSDNARIEGIGQSLINLDTINTTEALMPDVVFISEGLIKKLLQLKSNAKKISIVVEKGDFEKPFGNNQADYILTIQTDTENIGIRLKYNIAQNKYDILGWMNMTDN